MNGSMLRFYREEARLTQQELHKRSGVDMSYISMIETDKATNVSLRVAWRLCRAINDTGKITKRITPADLFPEESFFVAHSSSHATSTA